MHNRHETGLSVIEAQQVIGVGVQSRRLPRKHFHQSSSAFCRCGCRYQKLASEAGVQFDPACDCLHHAYHPTEMSHDGQSVNRRLAKEDFHHQSVVPHRLTLRELT